jgi:hypothetical protein
MCPSIRGEDVDAERQRHRQVVDRSLGGLDETRRKVVRAGWTDEVEDASRYQYRRSVTDEVPVRAPDRSGAIDLDDQRSDEVVDLIGRHDPISVANSRFLRNPGCGGPVVASCDS